MNTKQCKQNETYRKSYTRTLKNGKTVRVKGRCIKSQTRYMNSLHSNRIQMRGFPKTKRALQDCPKGYIKRSAFVRKTKSGKSSHIPEQCIPNVGKPGKGYQGKRGIGSLRKGELAKHGYSNIRNLTIMERHDALRKAIEEFGSLGVWRKLNAVHVYTRYTSPEISAIFKTDMDWIRNEFGIKAF